LFDARQADSQLPRLMRFKLPAFLATLFLTLSSAWATTPEQGGPLLEPWRWETFPQLEGPGFRAVAEDVDGNVAASNYDIVFIDLGMPGMPGDALAEELKTSDPSVVTILITGWDLDDDDDRLTHFDFALQKPLLKQDLENITAKAVRLKDQRLRGGGAARRA